IQGILRGYGLPWSYGDYHRTTFQLNPSGLLPDNVEPSSVPKPESMKVLHVKYAPSEDKLYIPTEGAVRQSLVWAPTYVDRTQAAVVEARLGQGPIYYCGDVNGKDGSNQLTLSLCGFKGECAPM
ncbi:hypothetical protein BO79DRAFT_143870, partial [Aspergillus costaricaensis CBS 115574]